MNGQPLLSCRRANGVALALSVSSQSTREDFMPDILSIFQRTPVWVFALFVVLFFLGLQSLRSRTVAIWQVLIVPSVFIAWGIYGLAVRSSTSSLLPWCWAGAVCLSALTSWVFTNLDSMKRDPAHGNVRLEASAFPLFRNMVLFLAKYGVGIAVAYSAFDRRTLYPLDVVISGLSAGYFVGWLMRFAERYRNLAEPSGGVGPIL
jgi:hypothetical protein